MKEVVSLILDESLEAQKRLLSESDRVYNFRDFGKRMRYWCRRKDLLDFNMPFDVGNKVIFYGSNDFHHITYGFLSGLNSPTTLLLFDRHTDCSKFFGDRIYCGSWIYEALKLPNIKKAIVVGVDSDIQTLFLTDMLNQVMVSVIVDLNSLAGKVKIFPYVPYNKRFLRRKTIEKLDEIIRPPFKDVNDILPGILGLIETDDVYVSIDKDVLAKDYSVTNWGNGGMKLDELIRCIEGVGSKKDILGLDVCGDVSNDMPAGFCRTLRHYAGGTLEKEDRDATGINDETNTLLLSALKRL